MAALDGIETTLRDWGLTVLTGDIVPGTGGTFTPSHVMVHHTASGPGAAPSRDLVRDGRTGIPGPLCHLLVRRDLKVELVSRGRANHAGAGGPWGGIPEDTGNTRCVGIEIEHAGTSAEEWTDEYMAFCRLVAAATLDHLNEPASHLLAHKEWAPDRKIDPYQWSMNGERSKVASLLAAGPTPAPTPEEPMPLPAVMVAANQSQAYYVDGNVKRKVISTAIRDELVQDFGLPYYTGVSAATLSLWPTVATNSEGVGQDAASQCLAQLASISAQLAVIAEDTSTTANATQVASLASQVASIAAVVADDASAAQVEEVRELVENLQPPTP